MATMTRPVAQLTSRSRRHCAGNSLRSETARNNRQQGVMKPGLFQYGNTCKPYPQELFKKQHRLGKRTASDGRKIRAALVLALASKKEKNKVGRGGWKVERSNVGI